MNNNMMTYFMNLMRSGGNPQQAIMQVLQQQKSNPMMANLLQLAQKGDSAGMETIARNLCKQRGVDFDSEFSNFKKQFGL